LLVLTISVLVAGWDFVSSGFSRLCGLPQPCRGVVLYYHAVKPDQRQRFARQLDTLIRQASLFPAGSPEVMRSGRRNIAVTFDDGFRSVLDNAVPELTKRCIPFTVFIPSGCLGERPSWVHDPNHPSWHERVLSRAELRALVAVPLATLGSHSVNHPNLLRLDKPEARCELEDSRAALEAAAGVVVDLFSFPHGGHNRVLVDQASIAGYRRVFTVQPSRVDRNADPFVVGRVATDPDDWAAEFRLKLAGAYRWRGLLLRKRHAV
jgi:peptidoglycan/xylan/chitin deacetylase (PgdA/CDA1 family)